MENASKALIMAGAILIAIVLIALGLRIVNSNKGVTEQVDELSTSMEVYMFNSQFIPYTKELQNASETKILLNKITTNNYNNEDRFIYVYYYKNDNKDENKKSDFVITPDTIDKTTGELRKNTDLADILTDIKSNEKTCMFRISYQITADTGRINSITIRCVVPS